MMKSFCFIAKDNRAGSHRRYIFSSKGSKIKAAKTQGRSNEGNRGNRGNRNGLNKLDQNAR